MTPWRSTAGAPSRSGRWQASAQLWCAGVMLVMIIGQWILMVPSSQDILHGVIRSTLFVAAVALASYEQQRNAAELPMYEFTLGLAAFSPPALEQHLLFEALQHDQAATDQFFGMFTGVVPIPEFFSTRNLFKIIGPRGMLKIMAHNARRPRHKAGQTQATPSSVTTGEAVSR